MKTRGTADEAALGDLRPGLVPGGAVIAIRREDRNRWERRAPLTPVQIARLIETNGIPFLVQPSPLRVYPDADYRAAGARVSEDLSPSGVILGVKEIPLEKIERGKVYVIFSHVSKGQSQNMPMLRRFLDRDCTLVDYENISDDRGNRLLYFGRHAGYAGMIDTLWALGRRLAAEGHATPFEKVRRAIEYPSLEEALGDLRKVGEELSRTRLPTRLCPLVFGFTGFGNVSLGAQEVLGQLPVQEAAPEALRDLFPSPPGPLPPLYKVVLRRRHRFENVKDGTFDAREFQQHPERFRSAMGRYLPRLTVLVHGAFWLPGQPRLVTKEHLRELWGSGEQPRLRVIGDISCDIQGGIEATVRATTPGDPVYVYEVEGGDARPGVEGRGPVILAVDNLPCEFPVESSQQFGEALLRLVPAFHLCPWDRPFHELSLPGEILRGIIVHRGRLTPRFAHLKGFLAPA